MLTAKLTSKAATSSATAVSTRIPKAERGLASDLQPINPLGFEDWDKSLEKLPGRSFFHGAGWARVLESTYGFKPVYFVTRKADSIQALLPLMEVDSWMTGRRGVSLPFTDGCEPLSDGQDSFKHLVDGVLEYGRRRNWKYVEIRGGRQLIEGAVPSLSFFGHRLELDKDEEAMFTRLTGAVRRAVRKAVKSDVKVEVSSSLQAITEFHALQCKTRKMHGLPPQSFTFFQNIFEYILSKNLGMVVLAKHKGRAIAGAVHFCHGGQAIYKYGASDKSFQHLRGNNLVMWEAIRWHAQNGATVLDLGRTSLNNDGVRRFKLAWGAKESTIEYLKFDLRQNRFVSEPDGSTGWYNRVFQAMPITLSRMVGAVLYRHWA